MYFIGVDVGLKGAIAIIDERQNVITLEDTPITIVKNKNKIDVAKLTNILKLSNIFHVGGVSIEKAVSMPGQGGTSMLNFGKAGGLCEGICYGIGYNLTTLGVNIVMARTWQKLVITDTSTKTNKEKSIDFAKKNFPKAILIPPRCRIEKDGRADALCIAEYTRLLYLSKNKIK